MIDRGAIDDTIVGDGVKIDNLVQIDFRNCKLKDLAICGTVGLWKHRSGRHCVPLAPHVGDRIL